MTMKLIVNVIFIDW